MSMQCGKFPTRRVVGSRLRPRLGTFVAVETEAGSPARVQRGIEAAFAAIDKVEALMHPTRTGSDLLAIHQAKIGEPITIHTWTWEVLALSQRLNRASRGVFDPCLGGTAGRITNLELPASGCVIARAPVDIDLGGIAKGFAVDCALNALRVAGCDAGLVNAGGDLAVFGNRSHQIVCGRGTGSEIRVSLENAALATSDAGNSDKPLEHRGHYHGLDHREISSGRITIRAPTAAAADGLTKCLLADPGASQLALLRAFDAQLIARSMPPEFS
ncbi:MAG: FAD:protein FMN transferase [Pseudomonadota bacterium]|nr:FAD:protein FMN transferase [Pseudomonadota bacterium]